MNEFISASEKMLEAMNCAIEAESEKRRALLDHDINAVETMLQEQQALTMRLEGLEKKRVAAQEAAGFAGMNPQQIAAANPQQRDALTELFRAMRTAADRLQALNKASIEIARTELRMIGSAPAEEGLYTIGGRKGEDRGIAFNKKI